MKRRIISLLCLAAGATFAHLPQEASASPRERWTDARVRQGSLEQSVLRQLQGNAKVRNVKRRGQRQGSRTGNAAWAGKTLSYSFEYASAPGVWVEGFVTMPAGTESGVGNLPILMVNRGGNRGFGAIDDQTVDAWFAPLAALAQDAGQPMLLLASNYRGAHGDEGASDQFGGADLDDVFSLLALGQGLVEADPFQVFMVGHSRGGLMTYLALRHQARYGITIRAAAVSAGSANLFSDVAFDDDFTREVLQELVPPMDVEPQQDYTSCFTGNPRIDGQRAAVLAKAGAWREAYRQRSAVCWADSLTTPLLVQHGTADRSVNIADARQLKAALEGRMGRDFRFIAYEGDDHGLSRHREESDRAVIAWFLQHRL